MIDTLQELLRNCGKDAQQNLDPNMYPSQVNTENYLL